MALYKFPTNRIEITGDKLIVFLIGAGLFYGGMLPIVECFTGQKTITSWGIYGAVQISRHNAFGVILQFFLSLFGVFGGVLGLMIL